MICLAKEEDIPELIPLVKEFCTKAYPNVEQDDYKIIETLAVMLVNGVIILWKPNRIEGILGAVAGETTFSRDKIGTELIWYIRPEHRGQGKKMFDAFEYWGKIVNCKFLVLSCLEDRAGKFYERSGYNLSERSYMKAL